MTELYRYHETFYSGGTVMLHLETFPVIRQTPAGAWVDVYGVPRWVKLDARKRYACPTKEEALASFQARKRRQIKILRAQLQRAEAAARLSPEESLSSLTNPMYW